jgi:hypothetical protein
MKGFMRRLEKISSRPKKHDADDQPSKADPDENDVPKDIQDFLSDAPMPDEHSDDPEDTLPNLEILDPDSSDTDESTEFDPDDTVNMPKK